jgi:hypothetical protein
MKILDFTLPPAQRTNVRLLEGYRTIDFTEFYERAKRTGNFRYKDKGSKKNRRNKEVLLNYLPAEVPTTKLLENLPSNALRAKYNMPPNSVIMKTRFDGEFSVEMADLQFIFRVDENTGQPILDKKGNPIPLYGNIKVLTKLLHRAIESWTFADRDSGRVFPINEATVAGLDKQDYDYLFNEFVTIVKANNQAEGSSGDESAPSPNLTETEKNSSPTSSTSESEPSEETETATAS